MLNFNNHKQKLSFVLKSQKLLTTHTKCHDGQSISTAKLIFYMNKFITCMSPVGG